MQFAFHGLEVLNSSFFALFNTYHMPEDEDSNNPTIKQSWSNELRFFEPDIPHGEGYESEVCERDIPKLPTVPTTTIVEFLKLLP
jgi:hypothetical protein